MVWYVVTVQVQPDAFIAWRSWMLMHHIPEVIATGCFTGFAFHERVAEPGAPHRTVEIRYQAPSQADMDTYLQQHAPRLRHAAEEAYGGKFTASRSFFS